MQAVLIAIVRLSLPVPSAFGPYVPSCAAASGNTKFTYTYHIGHIASSATILVDSSDCSYLSMEHRLLPS